MKLPSVSLLINALIKTFSRFPMVILSALTGTICSHLLIDAHLAEPTEIILIKLLMVSALGLPLFFAAHAFLEKTKAQPMFIFILLAVASGLLVQYYFTLEIDKGNQNAYTFYRYFFWSSGLHLLAAFSSFFVYEEINGFWQFNKALFLRFLTAVLYSGVLYLGLAGAILAVDTLFNLHVDTDIYGDLWVIISGLFNTIFFLGGIPEPIEKLNTETEYPNGLKIFTQYVLLTLVSIYLLILYAYSAKILLEWSLPKGWVANLIFGFSIAGIFSLLLVYPIRNREENRWIKTFSRFFYFSLLPLIVLLFVAIGTRISEYGVTVERYIVAMLGVWLAVITIYFIFSKRKNIILIPLTLVLFLFGSLVGPWGMFQVSERSQLKRLHQLLEKNGAFVNGKIKPLSDEEVQKIKIKDIHQINSILEYLYNNHSYQGMVNWFEGDCAARIRQSKINGYDDVIQNCIGLDGSTGFYQPQENENEIDLSFYCQTYYDGNDLDITGYNHLYSFNLSDNGFQDSGMHKKHHGVTTLSDNQIKLYHEGTLAFEVPLKAIASQLNQNHANKNSTYEVESPYMTFEVFNSKSERVKMMFSNFKFKQTDTSITVKEAEGYLLVNE